MSLKNQPRKGPKRAPRRSHDEKAMDAQDKEIAEATKEPARTLKSKELRNPNDWDKLRTLIDEYINASVAESWKGGGDPLEIPVLEAQLTLSMEKLDVHIERMERYYIDQCIP